jgi:hypothetical protein
MKKHRIKLEPSERSVLDASAQIFSAFITAGQYHEAQEKELTEKSVKLAIALAERVEELVIADEELPS